MFSSPFIINGRFLVDPELNQITDMHLQMAFSLNARSMRLLCQLAYNQRKIVSRQALAKDAGYTYNNADKELVQDISYLRRLLCDDRLILLQNIAENGYLFNGAITGQHGLLQQDTGTQSSLHTIQKYSWLVIFTGLLGIFIFLFFNQSTAPNPEMFPDPGMVTPAIRADSVQHINVLPDSSGPVRKNTLH